jgi:hypothetical protein
MEIWEYTTIRSEIGVGITLPELLEKLQYYGSNGWELVSAFPSFWNPSNPSGGGNVSHAILIFKRKKQ